MKGEINITPIRRVTTPVGKSIYKAIHRGLKTPKGEGTYVVMNAMDAKCQGHEA